MKFVPVFVVVTIVIFCLSQAIGTPKSGPFVERSTVIRSHCKKTRYPRPQNKTISIEEVICANNPNIIRSNMTVYRNIINVSVSAVAYFYRDRKWKQQLNLELTCESIIMKHLLVIMGVANDFLDVDRCILKKGRHKIIWDTDRFEHLIANEKEYGRMLWKLEIHTRNHTHLCLLSETVVEPPPLFSSGTKKNRCGEN